MSRFIDNKTYYFKLEVLNDEIKLRKTGYQDYIDINMETLAYYLKTYTIQKGLIVNGFRKIECDNGEIRYYGKEHPEYKKAIKEQTISIKNIDIGDGLSFYGDKTLYYIGSFYRGKSNGARFHAFIDSNNYIQYFRDLKKFTEVVDFKEKYSDKNYNYEKYILPNNDSFYKYYITRSEAL